MFRFFRKKPAPAPVPDSVLEPVSDSTHVLAPDSVPPASTPRGAPPPADLPGGEVAAGDTAQIPAYGVRQAQPVANAALPTIAPEQIFAPDSLQDLQQTQVVTEDQVPGQAMTRDRHDSPMVSPAEASLPAVSPAPQKSSWMARLKQGLSRTGRSISGLFVGSNIEEALYEDLESALIMADAGVQASGQLIQQLRKRVNRDRLQTPEQVRHALADVLAEHLSGLERPFDVGLVKPQVIMIAGVNGAGKTTSIGKLAHTLQKAGLKVLLAAGDTFRAAAREQLVEWGRRNNISVIAQQAGDPAAVAFDAVHAGHARGMDVVMVDTAGRLPTQLHLMDELKKIHRVIRKADPDAPHEVLLVVDGNTGQNALAQIKAFDDALSLTGLIVTKLDGTAKGGILAALAAGAQGCRPIPVYWIGVGEQLDDLQPFLAKEFAQALVGAN